MKDRDQKQLELIYESHINKFAFTFLKEEELITKDVAQRLAGDIMDAYESSYLEKVGTPTSLYRLFWMEKQNISLGLVSETISKFDLNLIEKRALLDLYETYIVKEMAINTEICVKKAYSWKKTRLAPQTDTELFITLFDPFSATWKDENFTNNTSKLVNALEKNLKAFIKFTFTNEETIDKLESDTELIRRGYEWRKQAIKMAPLRDEFPEIRGIF